MAKRSDFKRRKNDAYMTWDHRAIDALLPHLEAGTWYCEPCCGDCDIVNQLGYYGHTAMSYTDIIDGKDALSDWFDNDALAGADCIITNPPWTRQILHPMIEKFSNMCPTWLLFDADWAHTKQSAPYMDRCQKIVSVGRLRWIKGSTMDGKDNCAWYLFDANHTGGPHFYGRT